MGTPNTPIWLKLSLVVCFGLGLYIHEYPVYIQFLIFAGVGIIIGSIDYLLYILINRKKYSNSQDEK